MIKKPALLKSLRALNLKQMKIEDLDDKIRLIFKKNKYILSFEDDCLIITPQMAFEGPGAGFDSSFRMIDEKSELKRWFKLLAGLGKK